LAGFYPGKIANLLESTGVEFLDPIYDFAEADFAAFTKAERAGTPITASPLFNGPIGDGHFSPQGCELWAAAVGRRLELRIKRRLAAEDYARRQTKHTRNTMSLPALEANPTRRAP
jgi:hypothetical protein